MEASPDPCVRNFNGLSQRFRECNDPFATANGELPNCQGEPVEQRGCQNNQAQQPVIPIANKYSALESLGSMARKIREI